MSVLINNRIMSTTLTGVQRYLAEIKLRLRTDFDIAEPAEPLRGFKGHIWEQTSLALKSPKLLLWSPSNSGPVFRAHQVLTIHDMVPIDHPEWVGKKYAAWYGQIMPMLARKVHHVVTVSEFSRQRIVATCGIPESKVSVVLNGVDARFFAESDPASLAPLELPFKRYVLALGSIEPRKNLENLMRAWQKIEDRYQGEIGLVVAGGKGAAQVFGSFEVECRPRFVHFTGHVADELLPALYRSATAFCYTSRYEGFGLPLAEAMASGVPSVGSQATSIPEVVGDAGLLVPPTDPDAIAEAIRHLLDNPAEAARLGAAGRKRVRRFDWDHAAAEIDAIFDKWQ